jgi:hypothetical protein
MAEGEDRSKQELFDLQVLAAPSNTPSVAPHHTRWVAAPGGSRLKPCHGTRRCLHSRWMRVWTTEEYSSDLCISLRP